MTCDLVGGYGNAATRKPISFCPVFYAEVVRALQKWGAASLTHSADDRQTRAGARHLHGAWTHQLRSAHGAVVSARVTRAINEHVSTAHVVTPMVFRTTNAFFSPFSTPVPCGPLPVLLPANIFPSLGTLTKVFFFFFFQF